MRIALSSRAFDDIGRFADFSMQAAPLQAKATAPLIFDALEILTAHPKMGRPVECGRRELVISRGRTGYVALYRIDEARRQIDVLALRHQRESGYNHEDL